MKKIKLAHAALIIWAVTIAVFIWFYARGSAPAGVDDRTVIVLRPEERAVVLSEMRGLLAATQGIMKGASQNDIPRIIAAARAAGMVGMADVNMALMSKLPPEFKTVGMGIHSDMDNIATAATEGKTASELLKMTSDTVTKCVACHAVWQIKSSD